MHHMQAILMMQCRLHGAELVCCSCVRFLCAVLGDNGGMLGQFCQQQSLWLSILHFSLHLQDGFW